MRTLSLFLMMMVAFPRIAFAGHPAHVTIDVTLATGYVRVLKYGGSRPPLEISEVALPIVPGTIKPGLYRVRVVQIRGLENAVVFGRMKTLRTSPYFNQMQESGRPVAGSIVLAPDFGGVVFAALGHGRDKTAVLNVH